MIQRPGAYLTTTAKRLRWALVPLSVFIVARLASIGLMMVALEDQVALSPEVPHVGHHVFFSVPASPNFWEASTNWDGQWYRLIAEDGYPRSLPLEDGEVAMNAWAFYPAYPLLVRVVMLMTGLPFTVAAPLFSLSAALGGTLLVYRLVCSVSGSFVAFATVLALHTHPASASFQVAYTEGLALLLIAMGLWFLRLGRWWYLVPVALALSFTRPIAIVLSAAIVILVAVRAVNARRAGLAQPSLRTPLIVASLCFATMGIWPLLVTVATGVSNAYTLTQAAWPANRTSQGLLANWLIGPASRGQWSLLAVVVLILLILTGIVLRRVSRGWGPELRIWAIVYFAYLMLATRPTPSIVRYMLLMVAPVFALPEPAESADSRVQRAAKVGFPLLVCSLGLVAQFFWLDRLYSIGPKPQPYP